MFHSIGCVPSVKDVGQSCQKSTVVSRQGRMLLCSSQSVHVESLEEGLSKRGWTGRHVVGIRRGSRAWVGGATQPSYYPTVIFNGEHNANLAVGRS